MRPTIDTLIIVGNGFDIWQGLNTSYASFQRYYYDHIDDILKQLHLKKHHVHNANGKSISITDVELIYGDPFHPELLPDEFWGSFETSLSEIDAELLNAFFGKSRTGLRKMNKSINNARRILQKAFCDWIGSIYIGPGESGYRFGENCFIINFNYTDTLMKRFGINDMQEYHIHGTASDADSIIFGHASHPMEPMYTLHSLGGRFKGLYFVDKLLYETDKHVQDNIQMLCMAMAASGVNDKAIKNVYVLGQSISPPDLQYYVFLNKALSVHQDSSEPEYRTNNNVELDPMQEFAGRLGYVVEHVGYGKPDEELPEEYLSAVHRQYEEEQFQRNTRVQRDFRRLLALSAFKSLMRQKGRKRADHNYPEVQRTDSATWHIAYYGEKDRIWKTHVAEELGMKYTLHESIEECLEGFRA